MPKGDAHHNASGMQLHPQPVSDEHRRLDEITTTSHLGEKAFRTDCFGHLLREIHAPQNLSL